MVEETVRIVLEAGKTMDAIREYEIALADIEKLLKQDETLQESDQSRNSLGDELRHAIDGDVALLSAFKAKQIIKCVEISCLKECNRYKTKCNSTLMEMAASNGGQIRSTRRKRAKKTNSEI
jgi:hypothetical protein